MPNPPLTALTASIVISSRAWQQIYLTPSASDDPYVLAERTSHLIRDVVLAIAHEPLADRIHFEHRPYDPDRPDGSAQVICL